MKSFVHFFITTTIEIKIFTQYVFVGVIYKYLLLMNLGTLVEEN